MTHEREDITSTTTAPRSPLDQGRPCANCARLIVSLSTQATYCTQLCSRTADAVRLLRRASESDRLGEGFKGVEQRFAQLAEGDYEPPPSLVPLWVRWDVAKEFGHRCAQCGGDGTDVAPLRYDQPVDDAANLWLLCRGCHHEEVQWWFHRRDADTPPGELRDRLLERATVVVPRQPCDAADWDHRAWRRGTRAAAAPLRDRWHTWQSTDGGTLVTLADALAGFPADLEPWSWYAP